MSFLKVALILLGAGTALVSSAPLVDSVVDIVNGTAVVSPSRSSCFPALGFNMPNTVPKDTTGWWCDTSDEYAFVGFSYEVTACTSAHLLMHRQTLITHLLISGQSRQTLKNHFKDIRQNFQGRYVRLYGACDRPGF